MGKYFDYYYEIFLPFLEIFLLRQYQVLLMTVEMDVFYQQQSMCDIIVYKTENIKILSTFIVVIL